MNTEAIKEEMTTEQELQEACESIALDLQYPDDRLDSDNYDDGDGEEGPVSAAMYLNSCLDIEVTIDQTRNCTGAMLWVAIGGPNIGINTKKRQVEGYWSGELICVPYKDNLGLNKAVKEWCDTWIFNA